MQVTFYATLRQVVGGRTADFPLPEGATVRNLLDAIITRYPDIKPELLNDQGELYPHVHVFINGRDAPYLENGIETLLDPEAKVTIFPAVGGGATTRDLSDA